MQEWFAAEHKDWLPLPPARPEDATPPGNIKHTWVAVRKPLAHHFKMNDTTPQDWIDEHETGTVLPGDACIEAMRRLDELKDIGMGRATRPQVSPPGGQYERPVLIECSAPYSKLFVSVNKAQWEVYKGQFALEAPGVYEVRAKAEATGKTTSALQTEVYTLLEISAPPTMSSVLVVSAASDLCVKDLQAEIAARSQLLTEHQVLYFQGLLVHMGLPKWAKGCQCEAQPVPGEEGERVGSSAKLEDYDIQSGAVITMHSNLADDKRMWEIHIVDSPIAKGESLRKDFARMLQQHGEVCKDDFEGLQSKYGVDANMLNGLQYSMQHENAPLSTPPTEDCGTETNQGDMCLPAALAEVPELNGRMVRECGGAGWCQFLSVAEGLLHLHEDWWDEQPDLSRVRDDQSDPGIRSTRKIATDLRRRTCDYLTQNDDTYEQFFAAKQVGEVLPDVIYLDFAAYVADLRKDGWGDELTLHALAQILGVSIRVYSSHYDDRESDLTYTPATEESSGSVDILHVGGVHYQLIVPAAQ